MALQWLPCQAPGVFGAAGVPSDPAVQGEDHGQHEEEWGRGGGGGVSPDDRAGWAISIFITIIVTSPMCPCDVHVLTTGVPTDAAVPGTDHREH